MNFENILLKHKKSVVTSRSQCDTSLWLGPRKFVCPVVAANMKSIITPQICRIFAQRGWFYVYHRIDGPEDVFNFLIYALQKGIPFSSISVGIKPEWIDFIYLCKKWFPTIEYITVDVALSHTTNVMPILKAIRECYPDAFVILGNGATKEWVNWCNKLYELRYIDAIKVGIGVSSACRTRQFTGFGSTTVGSLIECKSQAHKGLQLISDGGLTIKNGEVWYGDIAKAIRFGADMIMTGAAFAGCTDVPSSNEGYYGNASARVSSKHIEGEVVHLSSGKTLEQTMTLIEESLRSSISYAGGASLDALRYVEYYEV